MKHTITLLSLFAFILYISSCSKDKAAEPIIIDVSCDSIPKSFSVDVQPIINANCVTCHFSGSSFANGQSWETHADISTNISAILTAINHQPGKTPMPYQMSKLSDSLINVIRCWAADGAQNN